MMSARALAITQFDPVTIFRARCEALALLVEAAEIDLLDAVDMLQSAAESNGLVREIGQDEVQRIIAAAFERVC
jgi:hypothetical protein